MNLSWLDDFLTLAAIGNFSRAADERHMTQPAFSRRIMALEEWLGVDLFDRGSKPPRLTETGLWFRQVAQDLLAEVARVPGEARVIAEANSATWPCETGRNQGYAPRLRIVRQPSCKWSGVRPDQEKLRLKLNPSPNDQFQSRSGRHHPQSLLSAANWLNLVDQLLAKFVSAKAGSLTR